MKRLVSHVWLWNALAAGCLGACGGRLPPPRRRVLEQSIGHWQFFRYQETADVEIYQPKNPATAHTASYVVDKALRAGRVRDPALTVSVFVSEYARAQGTLTALVRYAKRLAQESGYVVEEGTLGGQRVLLIKSPDEIWAFWSAGKFVVKVGGRGRQDVPADVVSAYGRRYPSNVGRGVLDQAIDDLEPDRAR